MVHLLVRIPEVLVALALLYSAFFLYEDEEGQVQDSLAGLWLRIEETRQDKSLTARFVLGCAQLSETALTHLFGPKIVSFRFLVSSMLLGAGSIFLSIPKNPELMLGSIPFFVLGALPGIFRTKWAILPGALIVGLWTCGVAFLTVFWLLGYSRFFGFEGSPLIALAIAFASSLLDALAVILSRKFLILSLASRSNVPILLALIFSGLLASILFVPTVTLEQFFEHFSWVGGAIFFVMLTRVAISALAALVFLMMFVVSIHKLLSPVLSRFVYSVQRNELIRQHKLLGAIGFALLLDAGSQSVWAAWLKGIIHP